MESLQELDLSNNKLCHINSNLINTSPRLKNLGLSQNPLYCDCHLLPLFEWTRRKFDKDMISFIQWQCEVPTSESQNQDEYKNLNANRYQKFTSLSVEEFICNSSRPSRCSQIDENLMPLTATPFAGDNSIHKITQYLTDTTLYHELVERYMYYEMNEVVCIFHKIY